MATRKPSSILSALDDALKASPPAPQDAAAVALAQRYALELDDAHVVAVAMAKALRQLSRTDADAELYEKFAGLAARIEAVHVAATVGPKLLAALIELNLTPRARNAVMQPPAAAKASKLDELRERRETRATGGVP